MELISKRKAIAALKAEYQKLNLFDSPGLEKAGAVLEDLKPDLVIPCAIGDRMWCIVTKHDVLVPQEGIVSEMFFKNDMSLMIVVKYVGRGCYGEKVFATKYACEKAIKEYSERKST